MSEQLSLFPELEWKEYEYQGKIYKRKNSDGMSYRRKQELITKIQGLINEHKEEII